MRREDMVMFKKLFEKPMELDSKSRNISIMYLSNKMKELEDELRTDEKGEDERWSIQYDIDCLMRTIDYLEYEG